MHHMVTKATYTIIFLSLFFNSLVVLRLLLNQKYLFTAQASISFKCFVWVCHTYLHNFNPPALKVRWTVYTVSPYRVGGRYF